jgi:hypothetical protein
MEAKQRGHIMLWVSDHMSYQIAGIFLSGKLPRKEAKAFLRAYIRACRIYHDNCLVKEAGAFVKGPGFDEIIGYIAKYTGRKPKMIAMGLNYNDRDGRLLAGDVQRQINWYHDHKMLSKKLEAAKVVDPALWQEALEEVGR